MTRVRILTLLDRRPVVMTYFAADSLRSPWSWIIEKIAAIADADPDEVECSDDNTVSVAGVPMFEIDQVYDSRK